MRTPNFTERLSASNAAKKAQLERAKRIAEDPERAERLKVREETIADRNRRIAPSARPLDGQRKSEKRPSWPPGKLPKLRLAKRNVRRGKNGSQFTTPNLRGCCW